MGHPNNATSYLRHLEDFKDSAMECLSGVGKKAGTLVVHMSEGTSSYVREEYKFVAVMCLLVVLVYMSCSGRSGSIGTRPSGDKWYHNMSPDEGKRVKRVNRGGYAIMSCNRCDSTAVYGPSRGCVPVSCFDHRGSGMVKVFGCSVDSCKKRCVRGGVFCKSHV